MDGFCTPLFDCLCVDGVLCVTPTDLEPVLPCGEVAFVWVDGEEVEAVEGDGVFPVWRF